MLTLARRRGFLSLIGLVPSGSSSNARLNLGGALWAAEEEEEEAAEGCEGVTGRDDATWCVATGEWPDSFPEDWLWLLSRGEPTLSAMFPGEEGEGEGRVELFGEAGAWSSFDLLVLLQKLDISLVVITLYGREVIVWHVQEMLLGGFIMPKRHSRHLSTESFTDLDLWRDFDLAISLASLSYPSCILGDSPLLLSLLGFLFFNLREEEEQSSFTPSVAADPLDAFDCKLLNCRDPRFYKDKNVRQSTQARQEKGWCFCFFLYLFLFDNSFHR